jgi:primosomal protein N' (replication factor Y)
VAKLKHFSSVGDIKPIIAILGAQGNIDPPLWRLAQWMSDYYATPMHRVMRCFVPPHVRSETMLHKQKWVTLAVPLNEATDLCHTLIKKAPMQVGVIHALLQETKGVLLSELNRSAIDALVKKKIVRLVTKGAKGDFCLEESFFPTLPKALHPQQADALSAITASLQTHQHKTHLLYGVTGSGKTEVYIRAIQAAFDLGKSAIVLVPEVSLTSQTIERFRSRLDVPIALLHHKRSKGERNDAWEKLQKGEIRLALGARSAIFCPIQKLGLIIVDEEHDSSYKQSDEMPCYQGRDVAIMRGHLEKATVVLGSATPSLESMTHANQGKYALHRLTSRPSAKLPTIRIVDMKEALAKQGGFSHFSQALIDAIKRRIEQGEQTLLFLNRRGYYRMRCCKACLHIVQCPHCDVAMTYHKSVHVLKCHICNATGPLTHICPACFAHESLEFKGFGTEHVERSLHALFPEIRTLRMDRDTTGRKESHEELFTQFRSHKADVLIGTQMIAKGFHFPAVTLVGVLNPDASLCVPDFRSGEQLFQLLVQVAGRAGRSDLKGEVILQTYMPEHPLIQLAAKQDYDAFYAREMQDRKLFGYPPFARLIKVVFTAEALPDAIEASRLAHETLTQALPSYAMVYPPIACGHTKIKDQYRYQILIKTPKIKGLEDILIGLQIAKVRIDVDPISTYF